MSSKPAKPEDGAHRPNGWFRFYRDQAELIISASPKAYVLLSIIALRAKYRDRFDPNNLDYGEALIGDHESYGMSMQEYRTAKKWCTRCKLATFRTTSRGTIAKLLDTKLFEILFIEPNKQTNKQPTSSQQAVNKRLTTNLDNIDNIDGLDGEKPPPQNSRSMSASERIVLDKELDRVTEAMRRIKGTYADHQTWTPDDRIMFKKLVTKKTELKERLGVEF